MCVTVARVVAELFIVSSTQIQLGAANHRPSLLHATGQLQRRARALSGLHVPYYDPTQHLYHTPVPVTLPHSASGFPALPAAPAAPAVLSGTAPERQYVIRLRQQNYYVHTMWRISVKTLI